MIALKDALGDAQRRRTTMPFEENAELTKQAVEAAQSINPRIVV